MIFSLAFDWHFNRPFQPKDAYPLLNALLADFPSPQDPSLCPQMLQARGKESQVQTIEFKIRPEPFLPKGYSFSNLSTGGPSRDCGMVGPFNMATAADCKDSQCRQQSAHPAHRAILSLDFTAFSRERHCFARGKLPLHKFISSG